MAFVVDHACVHALETMTTRGTEEREQARVVGRSIIFSSFLL